MCQSVYSHRRIVTAKTDGLRNGSADALLGEFELDFAVWTAEFLVCLRAILCVDRDSERSSHCKDSLFTHVHYSQMRPTQWKKSLWIDWTHGQIMSQEIQH